MIDTRNQWLTELARLSALIRSLNLSAGKDFAYVDRPPGGPVFNADAYNLSNSPPHNQIVVDAIDILQGRMPEEAIRKLIGELTFRQTYGAFSELVAYKWLGNAKIDFTPQVPMTAFDVLNPNGSIIDGRMILANNKAVFFDIKGFGFHAHKIKILQDRLEEALTGKRVLIEGAWDVSMKFLQELLDFDGFSKLVQDLQGSAVVRRGRLEFRTQDPRPVTVSRTRPIPLLLQTRTKPTRCALRPNTREMVPSCWCS